MANRCSVASVDTPGIQSSLFHDDSILIDDGDDSDCNDPLDYSNKGQEYVYNVLDCKSKEFSKELEPLPSHTPQLLLIFLLHRPLPVTGAKKRRANTSQER